MEIVKIIDECLEETEIAAGDAFTVAGIPSFSLLIINHHNGTYTQTVQRVALDFVLHSSGGVKSEFSAKSNLDEFFCPFSRSLSVSVSVSPEQNIPFICINTRTHVRTYMSAVIPHARPSTWTISPKIKFKSSPNNHARSGEAQRGSRAGVLLQTNTFLLAYPAKHEISLTRARRARRTRVSAHRKP